MTGIEGVVQPTCWRADHHAALNVLSVGAWDAYSELRRHLMALLSMSSSSFDEPSVCVLGAGNCNDLDLRLLVHESSRLVLVDGDTVAVEAAVWRQLGDVPPATVTIVQANLLDVRTAARAILACGGPFDVVASSVVLSQLFYDVAGTYHIADPGTEPSIRAVRSDHLQLMGTIGATKSHKILVSEVATTVDAPEIRSTAEGDLERLLLTLIRNGRFLSGTNPFAMREALADVHGSVDVCRPWRWPITNGEVALCTGILLTPADWAAANRLESTQ